MKKLTTHIFRILLVAVIWLGSQMTSITYAQTYPNPASPEVVEIIQEERNQFRVEMLGRQWWELPTDREMLRINRARYNRFYIDSLYGPYRKDFYKQGAYYRPQHEIHEKQNLTVFGWHPYWQKEAYLNYQYDLLTHIAFYGYEVNPLTGGYLNFEAMYEFVTSGMVERAQKDSCQVLLTVSSHGALANDIFFGEGWPVAQEHLMDTVIMLLEETGADGIDLNFEEIPGLYRDRFSQFVENFSYRLREINNNYTISLNLPVVDKYNVYDLDALKPWVDLFVVSTYNMHITPTQVKEAPIAPLYEPRTETHGTNLIYNIRTDLLSLIELGRMYNISTLYLLHSDEYVGRLVDTLDGYIRAAIPPMELENDLHYNRDNFSQIFEIIGAKEELINNERVRFWLEETDCDADIVNRIKADEDVEFFLFSPNWDTLTVLERDIFEMQGIDMVSSWDTTGFDIRTVVESYVDKIGEEHRSSLILGLPYYGAVWYQNARGGRGNTFEGYTSYMQIRKMIETGNVSLKYDKSINSMMGTIMDTILIADTLFFRRVGRVNGRLQYITEYVVEADTFLPGRIIYFDNSTSLDKKIDFAMDRGMGGTAIWALGYDHGYTELWSMLEENFANRMVWNEETQSFEKFKIEKSNKINFTIQYNIKRNTTAVLATLLIIVIIMMISFCVAMLDWRVRDALFYSGSFRLLYLALFGVFILFFGSTIGLFENKMATIMFGVLLGASVMWIVTMINRRQREKIP